MFIFLRKKTDFQSIFRLSMASVRSPAVPIFERFFNFLGPAFGYGRLGHPQSLEYYSLFSGSDGISVEESCLNEVDGEYCSSSEACEGKVELADILDQEVGEDNIFFIETSEKEVITPREACSIESAARNSDLSVVMVRAGKVLDKSDNTTCQMINR